MTPRPLLSIVVPTYQRAAMLRVVLQALLPQAAELRDRVEVCIGDNASTDSTADVVHEAIRLNPGAVVRLVRRERNLGAIRNLVLGATEDACGDFVWAIGDDDLVTPGTVRRICDALRAHAEIDYFYVNFAMASFPLHWPSAAHGGYVGPVCDVAHDYAADRHVRHWQELIDHTSSMGTQVYAHIVRRTVWTRYWDGRSEESHVGAYRALRTGEGGHDAVQVLHASLALGGRYPELVSAVIAAIQSPHAPLVPELVEAVRDALLALQPQRTAA